MGGGRKKRRTAVTIGGAAIDYASIKTCTTRGTARCVCTTEATGNQSYSKFESPRTYYTHTHT